MTDHVDPETFAAWADGAVSADEALRIESHLADCPRCRAMAAAFSRTADAPLAAEVASPWKWLLPVAATIVAAVGVAWQLWPAGPSAPAAATTVAVTKPAESPVAPPVPPAMEPMPPPAPAPVFTKPAAPKAERAVPPPTPVVTDMYRSAPPPAPLLQTRSAPQARAELKPIGVATATAAATANVSGRSPFEFSAPADAVRWRASGRGTVERSLDHGATWANVPIGTAGIDLNHGAAPSQSVCWLVGDAGIVLLWNGDGAFRRVPFPESADLASIVAIDDRRATVVTADGRSFVTDDGGQTWKPARF